MTEICYLPGCTNLLAPLRRLSDCPQLAHLPLFARLDMRIAYLNGYQERAARILTRPPKRTCLQCDLPGHALSQCALPSSFHLRTPGRVVTLCYDAAAACFGAASWRTSEDATTGHLHHILQ